MSTLLRNKACRLLLGAGLLLDSCTHKKIAVPPVPNVMGAEMIKLRADLTAVQTQLRSREDALELANENNSQSKAELQEKTQQLAERETRLAALSDELDNLRKQDSQVFRGIGELRQRGQYNSALNSYRMFMQDFPASPLVPDAERAITALTTSILSGDFESSSLPGAASSRSQPSVKQRLAYGAVSAQELRPVIKNKTAREISSLFGNPDHIFPNGTDWGYADRVLEESTGQREMLIITFSGGKVSSFRVGYAGRKISP